tara:strand:+ start:64528 stop:65313 length:786 start_codon:yes stop_codon:yes gene_type:complete
MMVACGQPGQLGLEAAQVGELSVADGGTAPDPVVEQQIKNCRSLLSSGKLQTKTQTIRFEDTRTESGRQKVCEFSQDENKPYKENLTVLNDYLRARYTQTSTISIPSGAVICDMDIESPEQNFNYDDIFFLSFNDQILASNHSKQIKEVIAAENIVHSGTGRNLAFYKYDWVKMRNTYFQNEVNDFCLGAEQGLSECQWPVTQEFGKIKLNFDSEILTRLGAKSKDTKQVLSFVITGDNDPDSDCYHERLDLNLEVKYYVP